jgi:hypothetical protein
MERYILIFALTYFRVSQPKSKSTLDHSLPWLSQWQTKNKKFKPMNLDYNGFSSIRTSKSSMNM